MSATSSNHISILDPLRGVAALAVVVFHYLGSILPTLRPNGLEHVVEYGKFGVEVFFVISGFVIPFAMQRAGYTWARLGNFMARRFVRIAPPAYIASMAMIAFHSIALIVNGRPIQGSDYPGLNTVSILANLTFSVAYFDTLWFNFVYWSLTAEFEFYLALALLFPFIAQGSRAWQVATTMTVLLLCSFVPGPLFFEYVEYFVLGILVFLWCETTTNKLLIVILAIAACAIGIAGGDATPIAISVVAALIIGSRTSFRTSPTDFLGEISYSLYITHVPVAYFAETAIKNATDLHTTLGGKAILFSLYLSLALLVAYVFQILVERPFLRLSKRIVARSVRAVEA